MLSLAVLLVALFCTAKVSCDVLHLTPFIERGKVAAGRQAALVQPLRGNITSYSGFLTVDRRYDSNLFFWFFPAEQDTDNAPLILWLQGGPGRSSLFGLFEKIGPYYIDGDQKLQTRKHYWSKLFNVLYIDNPVGAGFSYTRNEKGYSKNEFHIGKNLYNAVRQFFQLFPKYKGNAFYLSGSSYAGKFVSALAYTIDRSEEYLADRNQKINMKGLIVGNGFFDPVTIVNRSAFLFEIGLIDESCKTILDRNISKLVDLINDGRYSEALDYEDEIYATLQQFTGYTANSNYLNHRLQYPFGHTENYLSSNSHRIHAENMPFQHYRTAYHHLKSDIMKSVKPIFEYLLERYRILMYSGQMDLLVSYSSTIRFIRSLSWSAADQYRNAERELCYADDELAGYRKTAGLLTEVLVRNAGHSAAADKPEFILRVVKDFIYNENRS